MTTCPVCGQRGIGKVGTGQYYCWECCVEFSVQGDTITIFNVEVDGTLTSYADQLQGTVNLKEG